MAALARALLVALIAALVAGAGGDAAGQAAPRWERIEPGGRTACARGGRFAFWVRRADPSRLVIFFQGGGGCWDAATCAQGSSWFDDSVSLGDDPRYSGGGIFDFARTDNPFRGWSFVFVPSCTGDVYMGDRDTTYARGLRVRHRGSINAQAALRTAFARFPSARHVLVAGCSAGSVGAAFHIGRVIARYPRARVTLLGDSLAFPFTRPLDLTTWGASPRFEMEPFLRRLARAHPRRTFARFNYAGDDVQERFDVTGERTPFEQRLRAAETRLKQLRNYRSYLACGGDHCVLPQHRFYSLRVAGVRVRDWTANLAAGRNVGCPTCRAR